MGLFKKLFCKKQKEEKVIKPMPPWEEIVEIMYGKNIDCFIDEVVDVFYSEDRTKRFIILKRQDGLYSYTYETIYQFDEEEWVYVYENEKTLPAMWQTPTGEGNSSLFDNKEHVLKEINSSAYYKTYFK